MPESLKQKMGFVVAAMMMVAALAVLNVGTEAGAQAKRCKTGGGGGTASPSPSPSESEGGGLPIPPILPPGEEETESPSPTETTGGPARDCPSEITLNYRGPTKKKPARRQFVGKVRSAEDACETGRKVVLKKKKKGRDPKIDTTVTNNRGQYRIPVKRANGRYYTKTPKANVAPGGDRAKCGAAKSKTIKV